MGVLVRSNPVITRERLREVWLLVVLLGNYKNGTVTNCYYLDGCVKGNENKVLGTTPKPAAAFHNGEVAYLLNAWQGQDRMDWGQKLSDTDAYPTKQDGNNAVYGITF